MLAIEVTFDVSNAERSREVSDEQPENMWFNPLSWGS